MVKICDAIMGSGKSSAAITYMNEHSDEKFIYITPYLDEAERIKNSCPELNFVEPSNKIPEYEWKKTKHTEALVKEGRNITTTHQAFERYNSSLLNDIKGQGYSLIIDENLSPFGAFDYRDEDLKLAIELGFVKKERQTYSLTSKKYDGDVFKPLIDLLKTRDIIEIMDNNKKKLFIWGLPPELITSFKNVIILTYMFNSQSFKYFFDIYHIDYAYIGVTKKDGVYRFCNEPTSAPEYVKDLKNKIHILEQKKLNDIGKVKTALSMNWFKTAKSDKIRQLKNNISNCFRNIWKDVPPSRRLWATYSGDRPKISGKGYLRRFLSFNIRATNDYRQCDHLVYAVNIYMNVSEKLYYQNQGIEVNEDMYALSIMIQWIWRSAIRDGKDIYIYIPSKRMRDLLIKWLDDVEKEAKDHDLMAMSA